MSRVVVCEDDAAVRIMLRRMLEAEGYQVRASATAGELLRHLEDWDPGVLVLDVGLPDADGRDVCTALRSRGVEIPVLMLTAYDGVHNKVAGFHSGADDYLTKPFEVPELLARVAALLRRTPSAAGPSEDLVLDPTGHGVIREGHRLALTPTEFRLLARLLRTPGEVVRRQALVEAGWPLGAMVSDNSLDSYVRRLRAKLDQVGSGGRIETVRGVGHRWR